MIKQYIEKNEMSYGKMYKDMTLSFRVKKLEKNVISKLNTVAVIQKHLRKSLYMSKKTTDMNFEQLLR